MHKKYIEIEHTADAAIRVWGRDINELFCNAAEGMYGLIFEQFDFSCAEAWQFSTAEYSAESLLVGFLNELNYQIIIKKRLVCPPFNLQIERKNDSLKLNCQAYSTGIKEAIFEEIVEIKAVTYHSLEIVREADLFTTVLVFDL